MSDEYPICVFTKTYRADIAEMHDKVDELGKNGKFSELINLLKSNKDMVNSCKLPVKDEEQTSESKQASLSSKDENKQPSLFTPLHYAASNNESTKEQIEALVAMGASRCLKTKEGETAYDIAKRNGRPSDILDKLAVPEKIKNMASEIEKMEKGLHSVIRERVDSLIVKNGQELPQLALLFEMKKCLYYPVPGMYGGFNLREVDNGIQADSWIRICGGSEMNHVIDRDGNVTLLPNDNPL